MLRSPVPPPFPPGRGGEAASQRFLSMLCKPLSHPLWFWVKSNDSLGVP